MDKTTFHAAVMRISWSRTPTCKSYPHGSGRIRRHLQLAPAQSLDRLLRHDLSLGLILGDKKEWACLPPASASCGGGRGRRTRGLGGTWGRIPIPPSRNRVNKSIFHEDLPHHWGFDRPFSSPPAGANA